MEIGIYSYEDTHMALSMENNPVIVYIGKELSRACV
jgi:hypothetical protein